MKTDFERDTWTEGYLVAGFDEAGMGPWAGPVTAACVILNPNNLEPLRGIDDSKKFTESRREELAKLIWEHALSVGVADRGASVIDGSNVRKESLTAMQIAWSVCTLYDHMVTDRVRLVLIDGPGRSLSPTIDIPQKSITKGDARSISIAAASIIAKTYRDYYMSKIADKLYPGYGFAQHKGYGTKQHREALETLGPCRIHRKSYKPVKEVLERMDTRGVVAKTTT